MTRPAIRRTRREFLKTSAAVAAGAGAALSFPAPAVAQRPKLVYWCYQFLTGAMMLTLSETGRIDHLSGDLCRSTDLEAVRQRLYAWCAAGLREVVDRRL